MTDILTTRACAGRNKPLPHSSTPLLGTFERGFRTMRSIPFRRSEVKSFGRSRDLCSLSIWEVVLPAPRRRRAAGRERHDLPRYVLFIAHLQSSWQGQRGCWRSPHGHCGRRIEEYGLDRDRSLTSRRAVASQWPRLRQSTDHGLSSSMAPNKRLWPHRYRARRAIHVDLSGAEGATV